VTTNKGHYSTNYFINAAGSWSAEIGRLVGLDLPVKPDAHEAGITEAVQPMFNPMIVDIRSRPGSSNFYFYQHPSGKVIFCVTPNPQIWGYLDRDTSAFLPLASTRLIETMPKLANLRVRRTWRGTYPMTPDGNPILGEVEGIEGFLLATGACGQGFMLGLASDNSLLTWSRAPYLSRSGNAFIVCGWTETGQVWKSLSRLWIVAYN